MCEGRFKRWRSQRAQRDSSLRLLLCDLQRLIMLPGETLPLALTLEIDRGD
jgi:hypothetical protein